MFLHLSVSHSVHRGSGWYPRMHCRWYPSMLCRYPWGVFRPTPWGKLRGLTRAGSPGPPLGGLQAHIRTVSRPTPKGCVSQHALRQTPMVGYCRTQYASYLNAFLFKNRCIESRFLGSMSLLHGHINRYSVLFGKY